MRRPTCLALAAVAALLATTLTGLTATPIGAATPVGAAEAHDAGWVRPVDGSVSVPFRPGTGRFGIGGHTGVDLATAPGAPVRAAGDGVVTFAGTVAGERFAVVLHGGGLRTTYGFLASVAVRRGDRVAGGDVVGTVGGGRGHPNGTLHFGLRDGDTYLDPLRLFGPPDLTDVVRLVPVVGDVDDLPGSAAERRHLLAELGRRGALPGWVGREFGGAARVVRDTLGAAAGSGARWLVAQTRRTIVEVADATRAAAHRLGPPAARAVRQAWDATAARLDDLRRHAPSLAAAYVLHQLKWGIRIGVTAATAGALGPAVAYQLGVVAQELTWEAARGVGDWWTSRAECSTGPPPGRGGRRATSPPVPARLYAVGGLAPASGRPRFPLPVDELGYDPEAVRWFSYGDAGGDPRPGAGTWDGVEPAAALLARDLRAEFARDPEGPVDLVGHSLGGLVVEAFLKLHYRGHEREYPPIRRAVTLASPHGGSALAGQAVRYGGLPLVGPALDAFAAALGRPGPGQPSVRDIAPGSDLLRRLAAVPLPAGVDVTTVGAVDDWLVTADRTRLAGARHVVVDPPGLADHRGVATSPDALDALRRALAGAPPACQGVLDAVRGRVQPHAMRAAIEHAEAVVAGVRASVSAGRDAVTALRSAR